MKKIIILFFTTLILSGCFKTVPEVCAYCNERNNQYKQLNAICDDKTAVDRIISDYEAKYKVGLDCRFEYH